MYVVVNGMDSCVRSVASYACLNENFVHVIIVHLIYSLGKVADDVPIARQSSGRMKKLSRGLKIPILLFLIGRRRPSPQ